jgi:hypothetical protein
MKEQHKELEQINKQLITENQNLNNQFADRSIVVGHHSLSESNLLQQQPPIESEESVRFPSHCLLSYLPLFFLAINNYSSNDSHHF